MEEGRDLKKKLLIHEDESGLELSLGLSLGGGVAAATVEKRSSTATVDGDCSKNDGEWNRNSHNSSQEMWLRKSMIQQQQQQQQQSQHQPHQQQQQQRLREFLAATATSSSSTLDASSHQQQQQQQQQMAALAAAWRQMSHVDPSGKLSNSGGGGMPLSMGDIVKFLGAGKSTSGSSALGHPSSQQQQQQQVHEDEEEPDSVEQQKKLFQHQEARKKRKMLIDEQKQNKKAKDDDKPDGADSGVGGGLSLMQRTSSMQPGPSAMAALATHLMRRTISEPSLVAQLSSKDDGNTNTDTTPATAAATAASSSHEPADIARALEPNSIADETKQLLGMWQLGTTVDMPSAEVINPELSSLRPGTVAGQIGGTGSSPDLPWVSASGAGGKKISGVAYKMFQGQYKIVCSCHGLHMSPSEFVKHAESLDGVKGIGESVPVHSQVTPA